MIYRQPNSFIQGVEQLIAGNTQLQGELESTRAAAVDHHTQLEAQAQTMFTRILTELGVTQLPTGSLTFDQMYDILHQLRIDYPRLVRDHRQLLHQLDALRFAVELPEENDQGPSAADLRAYDALPAHDPLPPSRRHHRFTAPPSSISSASTSSRTSGTLSLNSHRSTQASLRAPSSSVPTVVIPLRSQRDRDLWGSSNSSLSSVSTSGSTATPLTSSASSRSHTGSNASYRPPVSHTERFTVSAPRVLRPRTRIDYNERRPMNRHAPYGPRTGRRAQ